MKKSDRITAIVIVCAATMLLLVWVLMHQVKGSAAYVRVDGTVVATVDLTSSTPSTLHIHGFLGEVEVVADGAGAVRIAQATCPDQICVHTRAAYSPGDQIICVPNHLVITVERGIQSIDALTQ